MVYRDGVPLAVMEGDFLRPLTPLDPEMLRAVSGAVRRSRASFAAGLTG